MSEINISNYESLRNLFGYESDGTIDLKNSFMQYLLNDMLEELPGIICLQDDEPAARMAVDLIGRTAHTFQTILKELSVEHRQQR